MTDNKEWTIKQNMFNTYQNYTIRDGARYVGECDREQDTDLIVTAVNSCKSINKDNPQVVAESIEEMYQTLKSIERYIRTADDIGFSVVKQVILGKCFLALNKLEGK